MGVIKSAKLLLICGIHSSKNAGTPMDEMIEGLAREVISKFREKLGDINFRDLQLEVTSTSFCVGCIPLLFG